MEPILKIDRLSKSYSGHNALNEVSLSVEKGKVFGLLGPNGAGKTTLIRIITGISIKDSGEVLFDGSELRPVSQQQIGYLPEERGLYKKMKVREQLIYLARLKGLDKATASTRTDEWIAKFGLEKWKKNMLGDLSKGMQQKIQFIAAVLHDPELIILDEPFSGLDPVNADFLKNEILELKRIGKTIILSTHRMENVEELCEEVVLINKSKVILSGGVKALRKQFAEGKARITIHSQSDVPDERVVRKSGDETIVEIIMDEGVNLNNEIQQLMKHGTIVNVEIVEPEIRDIFIRQIQNG